MGNMLSKEELRNIARRWKQQQLETIETEHRSLPKGNQYAHQKYLSDIEFLLSDIRESFALNDHSSLSPEANELLEGSDASPYDSEDLAYELAKARIEIFQIHRDLLKGIPYKESPVETSTLNTDNELTRLSSAFSNYQQEKLSNSDWSNKTSEKNIHSAKVLIALIGDKHVQHLNKADVRELKSLLPLVPKNLRKHTQFDGQPLLKIIKSEHGLETISQSMVKQHLIIMSAFLGWCHNNGLCSDNPFSGMIPRDKKSARDNRSPFTDSDIHKILEHPQVTPPAGKKAKPHQFWLPRLGQYTGARIEELCQLHCGDIREISGHFCLSITDERPDQSLKNAISKRIIPIHDDLIKQGFIEYVDQVRANEEDGLVFPELTPDKDLKYSSAPSKWFSRVKKKQGIDSDKTFHSFRHSMADKLRGVGALDYVMKRILGHSTDSETHDRYGNNQHIQTLWETINRITFDEGI